MTAIVDSLTSEDVRDALRQRLTDRLFRDELSYQFFDEAQQQTICDALASAESRADAIWMARGEDSVRRLLKS